jgi:uncharacterized protein (DUF1499 family)
MKIIIAGIAIVVLLVAATLLKNHARLFDSPGPKKRLAVYLTTNIAETADDHPFPELRTPLFSADPDELYIAVKDAAISLGWAITDSNDTEWRLHLVAKTRFLLFMDDVHVEIKPMGCSEGITTTALHIESRSRVGNADFAANAGHIQKLVKVVNKRLALGINH